MKSSPVEIEFLLYCYYCPQPHPRIYAPAFTATVRKFLKDKIIEESDSYKDTYNTTEKGKAWVEMICSTPYPRSKFIDPRTDEVIEVL